MIISRNLLTLPFYVPRIYYLLNNWALYFYNYIFRRKLPSIYNFRDGFQLIDGTGTLPGTIAVVFLRREYGLIHKFKTILDIGANMGSFMVYAAQSCPDARIYCYEPIRENYEILSRNIAVNSLGNRVKALKLAVTAKKGKVNMALFTSPVHSFYHKEESNVQQEVDCVRMQDIFNHHDLEKVDLLKMNCEGSEYEILENCSHSDFNKILNIRLEYHNLNDKNRNGEYLVKYLEKEGYVIDRFTRYQGVSGFIWARRNQSIRSDR